MILERKKYNYNYKVGNFGSSISLGLLLLMVVGMKDEEYVFIEASCIGHLIDYESELPYI